MNGRNMADYAALGRILREMRRDFDFESRIREDPVSFVRRFRRSEDLETAGLIASSLAYGSVKIILGTLEKIFAHLGDSPADFLSAWNPGEEGGGSFLDGIYHRFNNDADIQTLLWSIGRVRRRWGSLNNLFLEGALKSGDFSLEAGMNYFSRIFLEIAGGSPFWGMRSFEYFFPAPKDGSPCKRFCLYLRWMNRRDEVDPGGWRGVDPADLVVPVDTHIARIARYLGFTDRKNPSWKMALEITESLRLMNGEDPLIYDFLICHLGISGECPGRFDEKKCDDCRLRSFCLISRR